MTLGQTIGTIVHAFNTKLDNGDKAQTSIKFDFTSASDSDIKSWLVSNRVISFQRVARKLDLDEIEDINGTVIIAQNAGQTIKSRSEQIAQLVNGGIPVGLATVAIDNPEKFAAIMEELDINI